MKVQLQQLQEQLETLKIDNAQLTEKITVNSSFKDFGFEDELNELGATARLKDQEQRMLELEKEN